MQTISTCSLNSILCLSAQPRTPPGVVPSLYVSGASSFPLSSPPPPQQTSVLRLQVPSRPGCSLARGAAAGLLPPPPAPRSHTQRAGRQVRLGGGGPTARGCPWDSTGRRSISLRRPRWLAGKELGVNPGNSLTLKTAGPRSTVTQETDYYAELARS